MTDVKIVAKYTYWAKVEAEAGKSGEAASFEEKAEYYVFDEGLIDPSYTAKGSTTPITDGVKNAGTYTATYRLTSGAATREGAVNTVAAAVEAIGVAIEGKNVQDFTIAKATATIVPATGVVGVSKPADLEKDTEVNATLVKNTTSTSVDKTTLVEGEDGIEYKTATAAGVSLVNGDDMYVKTGRVPVEITVSDETFNNYKFVVAGGASVTSAAGAENTMVLTTSAPIEEASYDVTLDNTDATGASDYIIADGGKALEAPYDGGSQKTDIESCIKVTVKGTGDEATPTFAYLDASGNALVDDKGKAAYPTMPGKYQVRVSVGDKVVATVPVTVFAELDNPAQIDVKVDGRPASGVELQYKDGITAQDVIDQITAGITVSLAIGSDVKAAVPVDFADNFKLESTKLATDAKGTGTVTLLPKSDNGVYTESLTITYGYGTQLPSTTLKKASQPFNGLNDAEVATNGYQVVDLVNAPQIAGTVQATGKPGLVDLDSGRDYEVTASRVVDGKTVTYGETDYITEVGTYTVTVKGDGEYVGTLAPMTFEITPLEVKVGSNGNAVVSYQGLKPLQSGGFSAPYTGRQITPRPIVTVTLPNGTTANLVAQDPYDKQAAHDFTVSYGDNTTVAEGGTIDVAFTGNYAGGIQQAFGIAPASLVDLEAEATAASQLKSEFDNTVEGLQVKLGNGTVLEEGVDYQVTSVAKDPTQTGVPTGCERYVFVVTGKGNYSNAATDVITGTFLVTDKSIEGVFDVTVAEGSLYSPYAPAEPKVTVNMKGTKTAADEGLYEVSWENNENATTEDAPAYAVITGTGQYAGQVKVPFQIAPLELSDASNVKGSVKLDGAEDLVYNGKEQVPQVLVKGSEITPVNEGYKGGPISLANAIDQLGVEHEGGVNAGTSYMVIAPKTGNFKGSVKVPYEIAKADVANATIEP
ncbi:hypothetical protein, partial [Xiamenia xianingshaonis]|uniref:hypothetical protein n=1 Tax=Xiamenia xianingshaonis TaxID=2682776 RepID=UPI00140D46B8